VIAPKLKMDGPGTELIIILALIAGIDGCLFASLFILIASARKLRRRGYTPPAVGLVGLVSLVLGILLGAWLFDVLGGEFLAVAASFVGFTVGSPLIMAAITAALPRWRHRLAGKRIVRFPGHIALYAGAAICATGVVLLLSIPFVYGPEVVGDNLRKVVMPLVAITAALIALGRRVRKQTHSPRSIDAAVATDTNPPVLYLREFALERQPFITGLASELGPYLKDGHRWVSEWLRPDWSMEATVTIEEYLTGAIERTLGPFVALGSPEDYLQPLGAAREYAADQNWQQRFEQLAAQARAVLLVPGMSNQLSWELITLLRNGLASKLFVVVGAVTFASSSLWIVGRLYGWKQAKWPEFRALMEAAGYALPANCPRPLSVMGFDNEGRATLITNGGAISPEAYVHAIEAHLVRHGYREKVSDPQLNHILGDSIGQQLESTHRWMESVGLAESSDIRRELILILGLLVFQLALILCSTEMVPSLGRYALGFGWAREAYFAIAASCGAPCGATMVGKGNRLKGSIAGLVAGLGALVALELGLGWMESDNEGLFGLLELVGILPGIGLYLLLNRELFAVAAYTVPAKAPLSCFSVWAYELDYADSMDQLQTVLNQVGPWTWRLRSSTTYGSYLTCRPAKGVRVRMHRDHSQCTALLQVEPDSSARHDSVDAVFRGLLAQAGITGIREIKFNKRDRA
jgi:hypothetical protein